MNCRKTRTLLIAFHDGELPDDDRGRVEAHLHECAGCRALLADLGRADDAAGVPDPGPEYWDRFNARVMDRVKTEADGPKVALLRPKQGWIRQQLRYFIPAVAAAALVVVVVRFGGMSPELPAPARSPAFPDDRRAVSPDEGVMLSEPGAPDKERRLPGQTRRQTAESAVEPAVTPAPAVRSTEAKSFPPSAVESIHPDSISSGAAVRYDEPPPAPSPASPSFDGERFPGFLHGERQSLAESMNTSPAPAPAAMDQRQLMESRSAETAEVAGKSKAVALSRDGAPAYGTPPCELARKLAAQGRLKEAEAAQRACLKNDPSPATQESGLVFLAELLDRQSRFAEADGVIDNAEMRFPSSRKLVSYRQQRPDLQQQIPAYR